MKISKYNDYTTLTDLTGPKVNIEIIRLKSALRQRFIDQDNFYRDNNTGASEYQQLTDICDIPTDSKLMIGEYYLKDSSLNDNILETIGQNYYSMHELIVDEFTIRNVDIVKSYTKESIMETSKKKKEKGMLDVIWETSKPSLSIVGGGLLLTPAMGSTAYAAAAGVFGYKVGKFSGANLFAKKKKKPKPKSKWSVEETHIIEKPEGTVLEDFSISGAIFTDAVDGDKHNRLKFDLDIMEETDDFVRVKAYAVFLSNFSASEFVNVDFNIQLKFRRPM